MSTGMATMGEIDEAVRAVRENGDPPLALLHCNSNYPAKPGEMNLRTIPHMGEAWDVPVGLSDHTLGSTSTVAAVTLGASIVEKHLTLDRGDGGPDAEFSMEPDEFADMVEAIRIAKDAAGEVSYGLTEGEEDIEEWDELTEENVDVIRPGYGLDPKYLRAVLGSRRGPTPSRVRRSTGMTSGTSPLPESLAPPGSPCEVAPPRCYPSVPSETPG